MFYDLPKTVNFGGGKKDIRYDFRVVLDILEVLNDVDLSDSDKALAALQIFYVDFDGLTDYDTAIRECFNFINGGKEEESAKKQPKLMDWEQDFGLLIGPVNRVLGYEVRAKEYDPETNRGGVHWWTILGAYMEVGDGLFAQIVRIREKLARNKKLDKGEREWYNKNRGLVDFKKTYSEAENETLKQLGIK